MRRHSAVVSGIIAWPFAIMFAITFPLTTWGVTTVTLAPERDSFVRAAQPTLNYGAAGALAVSGTSALNGAGQPQGRFDSTLQFDTAGAVADFDAALGAGMWTITSVTLKVTEQGAPSNSIFNRGVGEFQVLWFGQDNWSEGTGTPGSPAIGAGNDMTYNWLTTNVPSASEVALGTFANQGTNGLRSYTLQVASALASDITGGGLLSLHVAPGSDGVGFTFSSVDFGTPGGRPSLEIVAVPEPIPGVLVTAASLLIVKRRKMKQEMTT